MNAIVFSAAMRQPPGVHLLHLAARKNLGLTRRTGNAGAQFDGHCQTCGVPHALPTSPVALAEARALIPLVRNALDPDKGRMVGVLIGLDHLDRVVVLRAYSGTTQLPGLEIGWAATTRQIEATLPEEEDTFERLNQISQTIEALGWEEARTELKVAKKTFAAEKSALQDARNKARGRRAAQRLEAADDEDLDRRLRDESWDESVEYRDRLRILRAPVLQAKDRYHCKLERLQALKRQRKTLSNRLQTSFDGQHSLTNFRGVCLPLDDCHVDGQALHPGTGECAAPKLLQDAVRRGVRPTAMAEVWAGTQQDNPLRLEDHAYGPCEERCRPILGHLLCGAGDPAFLPPALGLTVLGEGADWVAVEKPGWLLSTPGRGVDKLDSVLTRVRRHYPRGARAQAVHRLDMETSGVILVALNKRAQAAIQAQFARRSIQKQYVAWVDGIPGVRQGRIDLPLRPAGRRIRRHVVHPDGKVAATGYRVLGTHAGRALVLFRPLTGRSHQLRVHAADHAGLGAPIVGDGLYGSEGPTLLLHAWSLSFADPGTGEPQHLTCPLPGEWPPETEGLLCDRSAE
jgi:tRNA pseudouridine32 synthase/23S rRNA pseudouridine746 synthase